MSGRAIVLAVVAFVAFMAFVMWSTTAGSEVRCEVCMSFNGLQNCATAAAPTREDAERAARTTACAPISGGVTDSIQCDRSQPVSRTCQGG